MSDCFHSQTRVQRHPFERIATPFQVYSWTAPQVEHAMDCVRAEDAYTSRLGYEEHIPGQVLVLLGRSCAASCAVNQVTCNKQPLISLEGFYSSREDSQESLFLSVPLTAGAVLLGLQLPEHTKV